MDMVLAELCAVENKTSGAIAIEPKIIAVLVLFIRYFYYSIFINTKCILIYEDTTHDTKK